MNDAQLLTRFVATASRDSFDELVRRNIDLVYAAARRQTRDSHLADDITQAVFIILAKKGANIRDPASLPAWLIATARYAALNAKKYEMRRQIHEQKAAAMAPLHVDPPMVVDDVSIMPLLDRALARLREKERSAVILRYLKSKSVQAVAEELSISVDAAEKRISRGLSRLRAILAHSGINAPDDAVEASLTSQSLLAASPALIAAVTQCHSAGAASASAAWIASSTIRGFTLAKVALAAGACVAAMIVTTTAIHLATIAAPPAVAASNIAPMPANPIAQRFGAPALAPATAPSDALTLPNATFIFNKTAGFTTGIDPATKRGDDPALILQSSTPQWGIRGDAARGVDPTPFLGKRIRFSAFVKSEKLANWAGLSLVGLAEGNRIVVSDDMGDRPITGTTDWTRLEIVCDIPPETATLIIGLNMRGAGKLWMDAANIDIVGNDVPITDNQIWHSWSFSRPLYTQTVDESVQRNGHGTICLTSTLAKSGYWCAWDHNDRHVEKYCGKRMKMTAWIKTENVTMPSGFSIRVLGPQFNDLQKETSGRTVKGTTDWKKYEIIATVPADTDSICSGIRLCGKGKLWLDEVQYEVLDAE